MQKFLLAPWLPALATASLFAQASPQQTGERTYSIEARLEDRATLRALVARFSVLADSKDVEAQVMLFTEDAVLEVYRDDSLTNTLRGHDELAGAFAPYLALFDQVYHLNGQHLLDTLTEDYASGTAYCQVTLIGGGEAAAKTRTTMGVYYRDQYRREGGQWLIARRESHFVWTDRQTLGQ